MHGVRVLVHTCYRGVQSESSFEGDSDSRYVPGTPLIDCRLSLVLCGFVSVYLTLLNFILQLKFCLFTIVHYCAPFIRRIYIFFKVILKYTISMSHITSWSGSGSRSRSARRRSSVFRAVVGVPQKTKTIQYTSLPVPIFPIALLTSEI